MLSKPDYKVQIIGENGAFILPKTYTENIVKHHPELNTNYKVISIVGGQSSGKSTLINAVFSTDFEVLDGNEGIKQTTKGIWGAMLPGVKIFVMDVEGVDSAERWEEGAFFEKSTSLFSLVMSHLFIINIWTHDVRRFSGSNLKLLQTIFETNFRLFHNKGEYSDHDDEQSKKKIRTKTLIIVLRDFNPSYNLERIKEAITGDIERIWQEIVKPDEFKDSQHTQFFNIEFEAMPDYNFEREKFNLQTKELFNKFCNFNAEGSYFKPKEVTEGTENNPVPFESLNLYMKNVWATIRSCKDLDVPSQKALISEYRCSLIKNEVLQDVIIPGFERINSKLTNIYPGLRHDCEDLEKTSMQMFKDKASYYLEDVVVKNTEELQKVLKENLLKFLRKQVKLIKLYANTQIEEKFKRLQDLFKKKPSSFDREWNGNRDDLIHETKEMLMKSDVVFLEYDMVSTIVEIEKDINTRFDKFYKEQLETYTSNFFQKEMQSLLNEKIASLFNNGKAIFWEEFNNFFYQLWKKVLRMYEENLKEGFNLNKKDIEKYILQLRNEVEVFVSAKIYERKGLFNQYINELFDYHFNTKDGQKRNWAEYTEKDMQELYEKAMDFCSRVIDSFKNLEIIEHKMMNSQLGFQNTIVIEDPDFQKLFTDSECYNYKNMLGEYAKARLEYARSQCQKRTWIPNLLSVKSLLS